MFLMGHAISIYWGVCGKITSDSVEKTIRINALTLCISLHDIPSALLLMQRKREFRRSSPYPQWSVFIKTAIHKPAKGLIGDQMRRYGKILSGMCLEPGIDSDWNSQSV